MFSAGRPGSGQCDDPRLEIIIVVNTGMTPHRRDSTYIMTLTAHQPENCLVPLLGPHTTTDWRLESHAQCVRNFLQTWSTTRTAHWNISLLFPLSQQINWTFCTSLCHQVTRVTPWPGRQTQHVFVFLQELSIKQSHADQPSPQLPTWNSWLWLASQLCGAVVRRNELQEAIINLLQ